MAHWCEGKARRLLARLLDGAINETARLLDCCWTAWLATRAALTARNLWIALAALGKRIA
jgi:hypothetical protein